MQLVKWNPRKNVFSLRYRMNSLFDDFFYPSRWENFHSSLTDWNPIVDIYEKDDQIEPMKVVRHFFNILQFIFENISKFIFERPEKHS